MANFVLKQGSKGKPVLVLQKFLNLKAKLPEPIPESEEFGPETKEAVRSFQKRAGLKVDGVAGSETAHALAELIGPSAASFTKLFGDAPAAPDKDDGKKGTGKTEEKVYTLAFNGKNYVLNEKEFAELNKQLLAELKRTAVMVAQQRADAARFYWDYFNDLNKDQYMVSWFVSLAGPKLPDEGIVNTGVRACEQVKTAVAKGDPGEVAKELRAAQEPINNAYTTMMTYKDKVIGRGEAWVSGLEFVRDESFSFVTKVATAELGGSPVGGAVAGGVSEIVKSAAGELGKCLAGTSKGDAARNIALDGLLGAGGGFLSTYLGEAVKKVAESWAGKLGGKWLKSINPKTVQKFAENILRGSGKSALDQAIKTGTKLIKSNAKITPAEFFEQVAAEAAKAAGWGALGANLDAWVQTKFARTVLEKMGPSERARFFGKLNLEQSWKLLKDVIESKATEGIKKSMEVAIDEAKGSEKAEDLGEAAAAEFAATSLKSLQAEIQKRAQAASTK